MANTDREPARLGVVLDVDGVLPLGTVAREVGLRNLVRRSPSDRRLVLGMPALVRAVADGRTEAPVHYLTGLPPVLRSLVTALLARERYPAGRMLVGSAGLWAGSARRRADKRAVLDDLLGRRPELRWVLIGDDGEADLSLFAEVARRSPERVAAIGLRRVVVPERSLPARVGDVPVVAAPNPEELLPLLWGCLESRHPHPSGPGSWLLSADERGNGATRLRAWTEGNTARARVCTATSTSPRSPTRSPPRVPGTRCGSPAGARTPTSGWDPTGRPRPSAARSGRPPHAARGSVACSGRRTRRSSATSAG